MDAAIERARVFDQMRQTLPREEKVVKKRMMSWRSTVRNSALPERVKREVLWSLFRVGFNAQPLSRIRMAVERKEVSPANLLTQLLDASVKHEKVRRKTFHGQAIRACREPIGVSVDWIGIHFYVPQSLYTAVKKSLVPDWVDFDGISAPIPHFKMGHGPTAIECTRLPFSLAIIDKDVSHSPSRWEESSTVIRDTPRHEKWHDYDRVIANRLRVYGIPKSPTIRKYTYADIEKRFIGWFQTELSAQLAQGAPFVSRLKQNFAEFHARLKKYRGVSKKEQSKLDDLYQECVALASTAESIPGIFYLRMTLSPMMHTPRPAKNTHQHAARRKAAPASFISLNEKEVLLKTALAEIVSATPFHKLGRRLQLLSTTPHERITFVKSPMRPAPVRP